MLEINKTLNLFKPRNLALIGASAIEGKAGHSILKNLLAAGYSGTIWPVNPKGEKILGIQSFRKVNELPAASDLAVICTPPVTIPKILQELAETKTHNALIISSGFKEMGHDGWILEQMVLAVAKKNSISIIGPNSLGLIDTHTNLNASPFTKTLTPGRVSFFTQSNTFGLTFLNWAYTHNLGIASFVSTGNKADIDELAILTQFAHDPNTQVIVGYIEKIKNGQRFLRIAEEITKHKPIILLKSGRTSAGAKAVSAHKGAYSGDDHTYNTAFKQTGIIRANNFEELVSLAMAFSSQPLPTGNGVGIVTNAGSIGILAADACDETQNLQVAPLTHTSVEKLKHLLPANSTLFNPVTIMGNESPELLANAVEIVLQDKNIHSLLITLMPNFMYQVEDYTNALTRKTSLPKNKPIYLCLMGENPSENTKTTLQQQSLPYFVAPEKAVATISAAVNQAVWQEKPLPVVINYRSELSKAQQIIHDASKEGLTELPEHIANDFLKTYDLPLPERRLARNSGEAATFAKQIGFPVQMRAHAPSLSDLFLIEHAERNLTTDEAVRKAFATLTTNVQRYKEDAHIIGCFIKAQAPANSCQIGISLKRDPHFGALISLYDVTSKMEHLNKKISRLAPLSLEDIAEMPHELALQKLFYGSQGTDLSNFKPLEDVLIILSQLSQDFPNITSVIFNPVHIEKESLCIGSFKIVLETLT